MWEWTDLHQTPGHMDNPQRISKHTVITYRIAIFVTITKSTHAISILTMLIQILIMSLEWTAAFHLEATAILLTEPPTHCLTIQGFPAMWTGIKGYGSILPINFYSIPIKPMNLAECQEFTGMYSAS
jgi:hypothetical protein